ncbi:MAG: glutathione S-transferase family protein [Alphaproteobacteria bacterium]|nr:glutathione S-transferase family protein [Alphaproteobacteria bacterium]
MRTLHHLWLSAASRKVRIVLGEKKVAFRLEAEKTWERRPEFLALNPAGDVPVLIEPEGQALADQGAICEYLEEVFPEPSLIGNEPKERAEVRRLCAWFDQKFEAEVTRFLVTEKLMKRFLGLGEPDSRAIRVGLQNLTSHMAYLSWLTERHHWLAGGVFSLADIAAAAQISCIDYVGDIDWEQYPHVKDWYAKMKSRPSFRPLLGDHIPGAPPPKHYADLDF